MPVAEELVPGRQYIVDGTLLPCWSWATHPGLYSGKHKTTGMNVQVVCTLDGELVWISDPIEGARHDVFCLDESGALHTLDPRDWTGDKGYVGRGMITPIKKIPELELLDWQKSFNTAINRTRAVVERVIANLKNWRILHTDYRRPLDSFAHDHFRCHRTAVLLTGLNKPQDPGDLVTQRLGVGPGAVHHQAPVIRVPGKPVVGKTVGATFGPLPRAGGGTSWSCSDMLVEDRQRYVAEQRRQDRTLRSTGGGFPQRAILAEDARLEKCLDQGQDAFIPDSLAHPIQKGRMRNFVEAGFDVALHDPLVRAGCQMTHLGHRVMSPSLHVPLCTITITHGPSPTRRNLCGTSPEYPTLSRGPSRVRVPCAGPYTDAPNTAPLPDP